MTTLRRLAKRALNRTRGRDQTSRYEAVDLGDQRLASGVEPEYLFSKRVSWSRLDRPRPEPLTHAGFSQGELVMGVVRDGAARGYVLSQMAYYHVVNDELGGRPLLVTFCARCFSGGGSIRCSTDRC
jgi:hypothetical protein